jgi:hypothetical protein
MDIAMDITVELEKAKTKRQEIVNRINQLEQEKQMLLQEALRQDGAIQVLERISKDGEKGGEISG